MNTYLCPIDDMQSDAPYIESVQANSLSDARDKIEEKLRYEYNLPVTGSWFDFVKAIAEEEVYIGDIYDKEEF